MGDSRYEAVVAFLLQVDRDILLYILPIDLLFSIAVVAVLSRGRKPLEIFSIFIISFVVLFSVAALAFQFVFGHPFLLLEVYTFP
jgi:hypothetical protein